MELIRAGASRPENTWIVLQRGGTIKPQNPRVERCRRLVALSPSQFERYDEYYLAIHLNRTVQYIHVAGMLTGFAILAYAVWSRHFWLLVPYLLVFGGVPQLAHRFCDGFWSPAVQATAGGSLFLALRLNFSVLFGLQPARERALLAKYHFVRELYAGPPARPG